MISLTPWQILLRTALVCLLLGSILFGLALKKVPSHPISDAPLKFDPKNAHAFMTRLSKDFPNRVTWSDSRRKAALWIKEEFRKMGYIPRGMRFSEIVAGKQYTDLENVYVEKKGTKYPDQIIVVMAHYDITDTTVEGAMDDASGVGVVMELARVFADEQSERTLIFMATDSEEFGSFWGARSFAKNFDRADQIIAGINFDFVAPEIQTKVLTLCDGLKGGYTPLWLRELALDSLRSLGTTDAVDLTHIVEFIQRAIQIPPADHAAFLAAGIPAFNWVGQTDNFAYQMAHYHHTKHDVAEAMRPESFDPFGKGAERLIRSINELSRLPEGLKDSSYWKISTHLYMDGWAATVLHILAFIPFLAYCLSRFSVTWKARPMDKIAHVLKNETKNIFILLGSFLLGYAVMLLLPSLNVITQYEIFPATQKATILSTPNFFAMAIVIGCVLAVYLVLQRTFAEAADSLGHLEIRHSVHAILLAIVILLAFAKNSYLAVLLLLPPAYFWTFLRSRQRTEDRILNGLLLLGGSITFVTTAVVMTTIFHIGAIYWYLFLAATYGLISAYTVVLFFMALAIMIRLFRRFVF